MVNMDSLSLPKIGFMRIFYLFLIVAAFTGCSSDAEKGFHNIEEIKKDFIAALLRKPIG